MSKQESVLLEIISFLSAYATDLIDKPPESGGWVRTDNTAYREPVEEPVSMVNESYWTEERRQEAAEHAKKRWTPEARSKQSEIMKGNKKGYRKITPIEAHTEQEISSRTYNRPGDYHCSKCGRMNRNIRTCYAMITDLPIVGVKNHRITRGVNKGKYTNGYHVRWEDVHGDYKP